MRKPKRRAPKPAGVRFAEEIETLFLEHDDDRLDQQAAERAELIGNILFDLGNEARVNATHPKIVKAYVLAIQDKLPKLPEREYEEVQTAFKQIRDLMNGCSRARFDQIDTCYNGSQRERMQARELEFGIAARSATPAATPHRETEDQNDNELATLRDKLQRLDPLPENEAVALQLETKIYQLEREAERDEWPEVIGGARDGAL